MQDKNKVRAVLFAIGDKIEESEIARLTKLNPEKVKELLNELKQEYSKDESAFIIIDESPKWKLTVREEYMPIVQKIVPHTELSKSIMESLAVIAWKAPVLQSDIVNIRSTKAYDHIKELLEMGFITKQRHGRSYMIRLAQRFYDYFELKGRDDVVEMFKNYKDISEADVILEDLERKGLEPYDEKLGKLEVYDEPEKPGQEPQEPDSDKLGRLEVFEEPGGQAPKIQIVDEQPAKPPLEHRGPDQADFAEPETEPKPEQEKAQTEEEEVGKKLEEIGKIGKKLKQEMDNLNQ
jgi:segregation and condensation protein B